MPQPALRAVPLIAAVSILTWIMQLPPHDRNIRSGSELPAVARAWLAANCGNDAQPTHVLRVQADDLLSGAAQFDAVRDESGDIAACSQARTAAGLVEETRPPAALRLTLFLP